MPPFAAKFYPPEELNYLALKKELDDLTSHDISRLELLHKLRDSHDKYIKAIIRKYGLRNVVGGTRRLLVARVFKHRAAAEQKFSHTVFFTDCESEAEEALENRSVTVRSTRNRPRPKGSGAMQGRLDFWPHNYTQDKWRGEPLLKDLTGVYCNKKWKGRPIPIDDNKDPLSPQPVALPMGIQHPILTNLVQLLEVSCYNFAVIHAPEITFWSGDEAIATYREALLSRVAKIRHNVVHRKRVGVDTMAEHFRSAEELTILMGDMEALDTISKMWQAMGKEAKVLMHDTMAKFQAHEKAMEPIRLELAAVDARYGADMSRRQKKALAAERKPVQDAEDVIVKQAKQDYRGLSEAAGRAVKKALDEHGIILGILGVWISPPNAPTNVEGAHEAEVVVDIGADASELAALRPQKAGEDAGAHEGERSDVQPSENTADVKGKRKEQDPPSKKIQVSEQQQDVDEGGTLLRRQGESSGSGKVTLMAREEWKSMQKGINRGYEADREGASVKRDASSYSKKAQAGPKEEQKVYSANGSQNGGSSHVRKKGRGFRSKNKRAPFEVQGIPGASFVN
ncbi:unnamed protein product [Clonostachys rhizophaga]|uniref:Uncharacterized protein n=1 Tax=Clonostachys rhizophaga TaxID=160324 RepID=A0A9N9VE25_9HYPO|nr:unnamed protein product [Clonostachys rhizophaga]